MLKRIALVFATIITGQLNCGPLLDQWTQGRYQQNVTLEIANEADREDLNIIFSSRQTYLPPSIGLLITLESSSILPDQLSTLCEMLAHCVKVINITIDRLQFPVDELFSALKKLTAVYQLKIRANDSEENVPQKIINCLPSVSRLTIVAAKKKLDLSKLTKLNYLKLVESCLSKSDLVETYKTAPASCLIETSKTVGEWKRNMGQINRTILWLQDSKSCESVLEVLAGFAPLMIGLAGIAAVICGHRISLFINNLSAQQQLTPIIFYNNATRLLPKQSLILNNTLSRVF